MNKPNDKATAGEWQAQFKRWSNELAEKLPASLDETAKEYGVIVRKRGIKSAIGLIQMMLLYVLSDLSQRLLAAYAAVLGIAMVSDQAWQKKFHKQCPG